MQLYSTKHQSPDASLREAVFKGLPSDNGLYMPYEIPKLPQTFFDTIEDLSFQEIAFQISKTLVGDTIPETDLRQIINESITFEAPAVLIEPNTYVLELFHGPSLAFKDFGARFMARLMSYFLQQDQSKINILVATSGDTGGAVALGFLDTPNIEVTILYPSGKVSNLQEKQLTTLGKNIRALEVQGTFDDCQSMVKEAFLDAELNEKFKLSSANSINIARLIPQSFYYVYAYKQLKRLGKPLVFSVPSGNFGNLCAGLIVQQMGLPVEFFVASTNANSVVPEYLQTGTFNPRPSVATLSNAMDVGNPSNFQRMNALFGSHVENARKHLTGYSFDDEQTRFALRHVYEQDKYVMCPHTAVAYLGLKHYFKDHPESQALGVLLATAHPSKFLDVIDVDIAQSVVIPERLAELADRPKQSVVVPNTYEALKNYLLSNEN